VILRLRKEILWEIIALRPTVDALEFAGAGFALSFCPFCSIIVQARTHMKTSKSNMINLTEVRETYQLTA